MRIAVVTPEYPPDSIGGGGVVFQALVREYVNEHDVRVFTAADSIRSWIRSRRRESTEDVVINRYPLIPVGRGIPYLRSALPPNLPAWLDLRNDLAEWKPQVAHVHGYGHAFTDLAARILANRRVPYIFTIHGIPTRPMRRNVAFRAAFRAYERLGVGRVIRTARAVTAVSTAAAGQLAERLPIQIIPNGVSPAAIGDPERIKALTRQLAIPNSACVIVGVGRLSIEKGFDVLIKALDYVQVSNLVCVIAGSDGGVATDLTKLANKARPGVSVQFPGRMSRDAVADLLAIADVVVVPSREESFGLVALEALACRRRLVASRTGGLGEFLHSGVAILVPRDDVAELASAITTSVARGPLTMHELKQAEDLVAQYSWTSIARQYEHLMSQVLAA